MLLRQKKLALCFEHYSFSFKDKKGFLVHLNNNNQIFALEDSLREGRRVEGTQAAEHSSKTKDSLVHPNINCFSARSAVSFDIKRVLPSFFFHTLNWCRLQQLRPSKGSRENDQVITNQAFK